MAIEITNTFILRPSNPYPHPLHNALVSLTLFDKAALDLHIPILCAFRPPAPSNSSLKKGLSETLVRFPHLSARMTKDDCLHLNNAGIRLVETVVSTAMPESSLLESVDVNLTDLYPRVDADDVEELLQVQLNRFACGGLVIGVTFHHRVADGQSMREFLVAWAKVVRDPTALPSPCFGRAAVSVGSDPSIRSHSNPSISSSVTNLHLPFSSEFIAALKAAVCNECTTFECLLAHLWKKVTVARRLEDDDVTKVRIAVNGRRRMRPVVPKAFFGNLVLWAYPTMRVGDLVRDNYARTVEAIHEAVAKIDGEYFKSFAESGRGLEEEEFATTTGLCPNMEVDSWLGFQFHEIDFGSGGPCAMVPPNIPIEGLMVFVPSCKEKGGIDVFIALDNGVADIFKGMCYSLN